MPVDREGLGHLQPSIGYKTWEALIQHTFHGSFRRFKLSGAKHHSSQESLLDSKSLCTEGYTPCYA